MPFAALDGTTLFFTDQGTGPQVVLLVHGWGCDSHDWSWQIPAFIDAGYRVVAADIRGHGRSPIAASGYTPYDFARDCADLIRYLDGGPVVAVGHSLGAFIVSALAVEHPELVRSVIAVDPGYGRPGDADVIESSVRHLIQALSTDAGLRDAEAAFAVMEGPSTASGLRAWHARRLYSTDRHVLLAALRGLFETEGSIGTRAAASAYLARRSCPTLALHTDRQQAAWEASTFTDPRSRTESWAGTGHWMHQERPEEFNRLVREWLATL
jgi:pimeloyl-ACP methyl ester carboxylesterase